MVSRDSLGEVISLYLVKLLNVDVKPLLFLSEKMLRIMEKDKSFSRGNYDVLKNPKNGFGFIVFESNVVFFELINKEKDLCALVIIKYNSRMFSAIKHLMIDEVKIDFPVKEDVIRLKKKKWSFFNFLKKVRLHGYTGHAFLYLCFVCGRLRLNINT
jgi:hypothetical protein